MVLLGPRWVQFYILVCGLMELEFNFHTKERENPQIYEKPYPPDLFFFHCDSCSSQWNIHKGSLLVDFHQDFVYCDSSRTGGRGPARQTVLLWDDRSKDHHFSPGALLKLGRNFTQQCKATQQSQNPTADTPKAPIIGNVCFLVF